MRKRTDKDGPAPLPQKIKTDVLSRLRAGWLSPGRRFPSEQSLADEYGVNRMTARQAVLELIREGVLCRVPGRGTYVSENGTSSADLPENIAGRVLLILPNLQNTYYLQIISGIHDALARNKCELLLHSAQDDFLEEERSIQRGLNSDIKGIILVADNYTKSNAKLIQDACVKTPMVIVDMPLEGVKCDLVHTDDEYGAYIATCHLIELGHRRIAHISAAKDRLDGYKRALAENGLEFDPGLVRETHWTFNEGYSEASKLALNNKDISAIFAANDELAAGAYKALCELGISVPDDIALVGYGDLEVSTFLEVPLTTISQDPQKIGRDAAGLILGKLSGRRMVDEFEEIKLDVRLVTRSSCGIKNAARKT